MLSPLRMSNFDIAENPVLQKTALFWALAFISFFVVYKSFLNPDELMFKVNIEKKQKVDFATTVPVTKKITKQYEVLSVDGLHTFNASNVNSIIKKFTEYGYTLNEKTVPRIQPNKIPADLNDVNDVKQKKAIFIQMMLPMAIDIKNHINAKRESLQSIILQYQTNKKLSPENIVVLRQLGVEFRVKYNPNKIPAILKQLQTKVKPIPISLILAQSIVESGWGTSRFAVLGNALFGQWTYSKKSHLIPINRDDGKTHSIKSFTSPYQSMKAYVGNLNRNPAYAELRKIRESKGNDVTGSDLAYGLLYYSQEREVYVNKIKRIIKANNLDQYNSYVLQD